MRNIFRSGGGSGGSGSNSGRHIGKKNEDNSISHRGASSSSTRNNGGGDDGRGRPRRPNVSSGSGDKCIPQVTTVYASTDSSSRLSQYARTVSTSDIRTTTSPGQSKATRLVLNQGYVHEDISRLYQEEQKEQQQEQQHLSVYQTPIKQKPTGLMLTGAVNYNDKSMMSNNNRQFSPEDEQRQMLLQDMKEFDIDDEDEQEHKHEEWYRRKHHERELERERALLEKRRAFYRKNMDLNTSMDSRVYFNDECRVIDQLEKIEDGLKCGAMTTTDYGDHINSNTQSSYQCSILPTSPSTTTTKAKESTTILPIPTPKTTTTSQSSSTSGGSQRPKDDLDIFMFGQGAMRAMQNSRSDMDHMFSTIEDEGRKIQQMFDPKSLTNDVGFFLLECVDKNSYLLEEGGAIVDESASLLNRETKKGMKWSKATHDQLNDAAKILSCPQMVDTNLNDDVAVEVAIQSVTSSNTSVAFTQPTKTATRVKNVKKSFNNRQYTKNDEPALAIEHNSQRRFPSWLRRNPGDDSKQLKKDKMFFVSRKNGPPIQVETL
jgi:hypothetical protein